MLKKEEKKKIVVGVPTEEKKVILTKEKAKVLCERCKKEMEITGGGPSGIDYYCNPDKDGCGFRLTRGG